MKKILPILISIFLINQSQADSIPDRKTEKYQSDRNRLIPRQAKLQYAGSMGMFSFGAGWFYGKTNKWETDIFIGFIPEIKGIEGHVTTTLKQTYTPFRVQLNDRFCYEPLTTGIYINKIFGEYFWTTLPEKYPRNYYFWAVDIRFNIFLGQSLSLRLSEKSLIKEMSFFYEFNTNDLYLISAFGNKTIGMKEILGLSFGIRTRLF